MVVGGGTRCDAGGGGNRGRGMGGLREEEG